MSLLARLMNWLNPPKHHDLGTTDAEHTRRLNEAKKEQLRLARRVDRLETEADVLRRRRR